MSKQASPIVGFDGGQGVVYGAPSMSRTPMYSDEAGVVSLKCLMRAGLGRCLTQYPDSRFYRLRIFTVRLLLVFARLECKLDQLS